MIADNCNIVNSKWIEGTAKLKYFCVKKGVFAVDLKTSKITIPGRVFFNLLFF